MRISPTILIGIAVVFVVLLATFFSVAPAAAGVRAGVLRAIAVIGVGVGYVYEWTSAAVSTPASERISLLERERTLLLGEIARGDEIRRENEALRSILELRNDGEEGVIPARVAGGFRSGRDEFLLINRGIRDGVTVGGLVLDQARVLGGTVVEVSSHTATVRLLTSPSTNIEVILSRTDIEGILRGANSGELLLDLVPGDADVNRGDLVVSSPRSVSGRTGFLIGEVRESRETDNSVFKEIRVFHLFHADSGNVLVIINDQ